MLPIQLDLSLTHFKRPQGDLTVYGTWLLDGTGDRPCLVILRTNEERHPDAIPVVITIDQAWRWSDGEGGLPMGDPEYASHQAQLAGQHLRLTDDVRTVLRIVALVNAHLGDLLSIPPFPREKGNVLGELTITNRSTGETTEVEIPDDV